MDTSCQCRSLSGSPGASQHLRELHLPACTSLSILSAPYHLLLVLRGPLLCSGPFTPLRLETGQHLLLAHPQELTLSTSGERPALILLWSFTPEALPATLASTLPKAPLAPAGPGPASAALHMLSVGLRACPVSPSLRDFWGNAKLLEWLSLILPSSDSPDTPSPPPLLHPAVQSAIRHMQANLDLDIGLPELARAAATSPAHLSRLFSARFGWGPTHHLRKLRMEHAASLLRSGTANVTETALACGYASLAQFSRAFQEHHGCPPSSLLPRNSAS